MNIGFNHRAVFVRAIVVGGDAASAEINPFAHGRVAQIRQMVGLGTIGQSGVFDLDKVADMHFFAQFRAWSQPCKRTNQRTRPD